MSKFQQKNSEALKKKQKKTRTYSPYAGKRFQINNLNFHIEELEKKETN